MKSTHFVDKMQNQNENQLSQVRAGPATTQMTDALYEFLCLPKGEREKE